MMRSTHRASSLLIMVVEHVEHDNILLGIQNNTNREFRAADQCQVAAADWSDRFTLARTWKGKLRPGLLL